MRRRPEVQRADPLPAKPLERLGLVLEDRWEHERARTIRQLGERRCDEVGQELEVAAVVRAAPLRCARIHDPL